MKFLETHVPKPEWLKVGIPSGEVVAFVAEVKQENNLFTVCEEAKCPNRQECWSSGTATFMLMGGVCTRACRFCSVTHGSRPESLDPDEPSNVAEAVRRLGLKYVVITSVNRDDLPDGGAQHFAHTITAIRVRNPDTKVEVLIPDFLGENLDYILNSDPDVIAHNVETVERLTSKVRDPRANYRKSLKVLREIKEKNPLKYTKSSIMVGVGETWEDLESTFADLRNIGVDFLTIGQYLRPSMKHMKVEKYVHPDVFMEMHSRALTHGFKYVVSGPLVRSSYRAGELFLDSLLRRRTP